VNSESPAALTAFSMLSFIVSPLVLLLLIGGRLAHRAAPGEPGTVSVGQLLACAIMSMLQRAFAIASRTMLLK
jgi:hypothetical protein